jgi:hypothetical protein
MIVSCQGNKLRNPPPNGRRNPTRGKYFSTVDLVFGHVCASESAKTTKGLSLIYISNKPEFRQKRSTNISRRCTDTDKIRKQKVIYFTSTNDEGMYPISLLDKL